MILIRIRPTRLYIQFLMKYIKLACPVIPFITEEIYQNLKTDTMPDSIHLCDYPEAEASVRDEQLEKKMEVTQHAVFNGKSTPC